MNLKKSLSYQASNQRHGRMYEDCGITDTPRGGVCHNWRTTGAQQCIEAGVPREIVGKIGQWNQSANAMELCYLRETFPIQGILQRADHGEFFQTSRGCLPAISQLRE